MISNYDLDPVLLRKADKTTSMITTNYVYPNTKPNNSPQLSKYQARNNRYMQHRRAKKKNLSDKELMINRDARSSKKKDLTKHKFHML